MMKSMVGILSIALLLLFGATFAHSQQLWETQTYTESFYTIPYGGFAIATDANQNVFVTGNVAGNLVNGRHTTDIATIKYDSTGKQVWMVTLPGIAERVSQDSPMNTTDQQIQQTTELLASMYRALVALRTDVLPVNPELYAVMAEGPLEQIRRLLQGLDVIAGISTARAHQQEVLLEHLERTSSQ